MLDPDEALAQRLLAAVPGLRAELDDYLRKYVGDWAGPQSDADHLRGFLVKLALDSRRRDAERRALPRQVFDFLESERGRDEEIDGLIETYFTAYLPESTDQSAAVLESVVEFVYRLGEDVPELRDRMDRHPEFPGHTRWADAVLAEIAVDAVELVATGRALIVLPLLEFLELEYGENPAVDTVIEVAFLELLPGPGERGREIVDLLGPELRAERLRMDPPAGQGNRNR